MPAGGFTAGSAWFDLTPPERRPYPPAPRLDPYADPTASAILPRTLPVWPPFTEPVRPRWSWDPRRLQGETVLRSFPVSEDVDRMLAWFAPGQTPTPQARLRLFAVEYHTVYPLIGPQQMPGFDGSYRPPPATARVRERAPEIVPLYTLSQVWDAPAPVLLPRRGGPRLAEHDQYLGPIADDMTVLGTWRTPEPGPRWPPARADRPAAGEALPGPLVEPSLFHAWETAALPAPRPSRGLPAAVFVFQAPFQPLGHPWDHQLQQLPVRSTRNQPAAAGELPPPQFPGYPWFDAPQQHLVRGGRPQTAAAYFDRGQAADADLVLWHAWDLPAAAPPRPPRGQPGPSASDAQTQFSQGNAWDAQTSAPPARPRPQSAPAQLDRLTPADADAALWHAWEAPIPTPRPTARPPAQQWPAEASAWLYDVALLIGWRSDPQTPRAPGRPTAAPAGDLPALPAPDAGLCCLFAPTSGPQPRRRPSWTWTVALEPPPRSTAGSGLVFVVAGPLRTTAAGLYAAGASVGDVQEGG
jgi:hypothetical protein